MLKQKITIYYTKREIAETLIQYAEKQIRSQLRDKDVCIQLDGTENVDDTMRVHFIVEDSTKVEAELLNLRDMQLIDCDAPDDEAEIEIAMDKKLKSLGYT